MASISSIGTSESDAALLIENKQSSGPERYTLFMPEFVKNAWAGCSIEFTPSDNLPIRLSHEKSVSQLGLTMFVAMQVPRRILKSGKHQNIWSSARYIQKSEELKKIFSSVPSNDQSKALEYLLGQTIRVGGGIEWIQGAEYPKCIECNRKMEFIAQVSGTWFPATVKFNVRESEIYIFGCEKHHDKIQKVVQFY